jgi:hypothetical protein
MTSTRRPKGWELSRETRSRDLKEPVAPRKVLQPPKSKIGEPNSSGKPSCEGGSRRLGHDYLAAMSCGANPRPTMHPKPDEPTSDCERARRVHPHTHETSGRRDPREPLLRIDRSLKCVTWVSKCDEERVALSVDLAAFRARYSRSNRASMARN